jgi:trans-aconitate methyltransferase
MKPGSYRYFLGVDYAQASIEKARERQLPQAEFEVADALHFEPVSEFDVIVFNEAFYYIEDRYKRRVLDRILGKLSKNGLLIVSIYREGTGCWEYFKEHPGLKEVAFKKVTTDEELRYWKVGAYQPT